MGRKKINTGLLDKIGKVLEIVPNVADVVESTMREVAPLIEKSMDRRYEKKQSLVTLPNVIDIDVSEAQSILEDFGFRVVALKGKVNKNYANK